MVKKVQKSSAKSKATSKNASPLSGAIKDSAQQIWLAGLGAFSKAQAEGGKAFETLVKEGLSIQRKTQAVAEERISEATNRVSDMASDISSKATGLEQAGCALCPRRRSTDQAHRRAQQPGHRHQGARQSGQPCAQSCRHQGAGQKGCSTQGRCQQDRRAQGTGTQASRAQNGRLRNRRRTSRSLTLARGPQARR